jgi:hypothetical protein
MSLTCHPRNWEGRQEDHKFEDSLCYTVSSMEGRKEGKKEERKEGRKELSFLANLFAHGKTTKNFPRELAFKMSHCKKCVNHKILS